MGDYGDEHLDYAREGEKSWRRLRTLKPKRKRKDSPYQLKVPTIGVWLWRAIEWVTAEEERKTGKKPSRSRVVRGLLQLGVYRYRDLGKLPVIGRMKNE